MAASISLVRPQFVSEFDAQIGLWISRLCVRYSGAVSQLDFGTYSEEIYQLVGLKVSDDTKVTHRKIKPYLVTATETITKLQKSRRTVLSKNIAMLSELVGFSEIEQSIIYFVALYHQNEILSEIVSSIRTSTLDDLARMLSCALDVEEFIIKQIVRGNTQLIASRIIKIERGPIGRSVSLEMPEALVAALFTAVDNIRDLMKSFLEVAPLPKLNASNFSHLREETELLANYIAKAQRSGVVGINIMIYGAPGTGKTEYVRWLIQHLGKKLYQVRAADDQGRPITGLDRLAFYQFSQHFLQNSNGLILFDEIEDVFPSHDHPFELEHRTRSQTPGKLFFNQILECNPVPSIWISNEVSHIDKAYLRRFDFSFEMGVPPIAVRKQVLHGYLKEEMIPSETLSYLAQQDELSPAQIEKAAKVIKHFPRRAEQRADTLMLVIENSMALLEQQQSNKFIDFTDCSYQLDFLNPDCDIKSLVTQLKKSDDPVGALCFYGAPGTGKTALAHYIAHAIDLPITVKRASDIMSSYVGETEQKIAKMFRQARQAGSILLLDEADSFLTDRKSARNSWEITAVNEMLTQMEQFDGLFICSTNLMEKLDVASLRRFALKVKFDYMKPEQRWALFEAQAKRLKRSQENEFRAALNTLSNLTPGDFATIRRQAALFGTELTAEELLIRLTQESRNKQSHQGKPIGFLTS